jgi:protein-S-isoprenylcysteine O-methyltransferase Ste14
VARSLVAVNLVLLAGLVFTPGASVWAVPVWLAASPLPSAAARLRTTGPYACVRHPIYSGLLFGGAGVALLGWPADACRGVGRVAGVAVGQESLRGT